MRLTLANQEAIKYACIKFHYARTPVLNGVGYNVYNDDDEWCGCIIYSRGANKHIGTEYGLVQGSILELVRVALNGKQECTTKALAMSIKQLKKDVPLCRLIVSYADCDQSHLGTIYQATNWIYVGQKGVDMVSAYYINGVRKHKKTLCDQVRNMGGLRGMNMLDFLRKYIDPKAVEHRTKGKRKYLMPLDKKMRKQILPMSQPYPKNEDWVKIDRNQFKKQ